jgi:hypothetical protein
VTDDAIKAREPLDPIIIQCLKEAESSRCDWDEYPEGSLMKTSELVREVVAHYEAQGGESL